MKDNDSSVEIAAEAARRFATDALVKVGLPAADASEVAALMIEADLAGASAHGIFRLKQYVHRLKLGAINPHPMIKVTKTAPGTAIVDGDNGMGHIVVARAVETAIEQARQTGVAWVGVHNSNHAGAAGTYATLVAERGMVGIYSAVASANHMGVWGGSEPLLGTNPLAIAIPSEKWPVVLDIATSIVSYGTIKSYRLKGRPLPDNWMIGVEDGSPITDPVHSNEGLLLPFGGYKGAGLALVLGLLAGSLNRAPFGRGVVDFNAHPERVCDTGQFLIALDVARFRPLSEFVRSVATTLEDFRNSARLPGYGAIRLPGDQRHYRRQAQIQNGLLLSSELTEQLDVLANELEIRPLQECIAAIRA
ncbi:MAG: Ldh family oxidoreductase [Proteobacteria bacterium]|nr:Ldh family oxidoreductase [Pseudomonadota bacterium]